MEDQERFPGDGGFYGPLSFEVKGLFHATTSFV